MRIIILFICVVLLQSVAVGQKRDSLLNQFDSNSKKTGVWVEKERMNELGGLILSVSKGSYINGRRDGLWIEYIEENDSKKVTAIVSYKEGLLHGDVKLFSDNKSKLICTIFKDEALEFVNIKSGKKN